VAQQEQIYTHTNTQQGDEMNRRQVGEDCETCGRVKINSNKLCWKT